MNLNFKCYLEIKYKIIYNVILYKMAANKKTQQKKYLTKKSKKQLKKKINKKLSRKQYKKRRTIKKFGGDGEKPPSIHTIMEKKNHKFKSHVYETRYKIQKLIQTLNDCKAKKTNSVKDETCEENDKNKESVKTAMDGKSILRQYMAKFTRFKERHNIDIFTRPTFLSEVLKFCMNIIENKNNIRDKDKIKKHLDTIDSYVKFVIFHFFAKSETIENNGSNIDLTPIKTTGEFDNIKEMHENPKDENKFIEEQKIKEEEENNKIAENNKIDLLETNSDIDTSWNAFVEYIKTKDTNINELSYLSKIEFIYLMKFNTNQQSGGAIGGEVNVKGGLTAFGYGCIMIVWGFPFTTILGIMCVFFGWLMD